MPRAETAWSALRVGALAALIVVVAVFSASGSAYGAVPPAAPSFAHYPAPANLSFYSSSLGAPSAFAGETSIGVNPLTNNALFQISVTTARVAWDDRRNPPTASWKNVSFELNTKRTADPILWTDRLTGRTFVSHNQGAVSALGASASLLGFTDNDGDSWTLPEPASTFPSADHQTVGTGPWAPPAPPRVTAYPNAVYHCAQGGSFSDEVPEVGQKGGSQCARSDNGGLTWGTPLPVQLFECEGIHGHVVVGEDGTVYVPHRSCGDSQGVLVSRDNGVTWTLRPVPGTKASFVDYGCPVGDCRIDPHLFGDPKVAIDAGGRLYFGTASAGKAIVATSTDRGESWTAPIDVGEAFKIANAVFPMTIAGDAKRAAFAFYGTTDGGNDQSPDFKGVWHLYVATTLDGGLGWKTVEATSHDPVQRGCIWLLGGSNACRNLLDFQDMTLDRDGRILVGYADGCTSAKCTGPHGTPADSRDSHAVIARQVAGAHLHTQPTSRCAGVTRAAKTCPQLRLSMQPRRARAGRSTLYRFTVTADVRGKRRRIRGVLVRFAGRKARTNRQGKARIVGTFARTGRYRATATQTGYASSAATVRIAA
jgi:hypothetical protein